MSWELGKIVKKHGLGACCTLVWEKKCKFALTESSGRTVEECQLSVYSGEGVDVSGRGVWPPVPENPVQTELKGKEHIMYPTA